MYPQIRPRASISFTMLLTWPLKEASFKMSLKSGLNAATLLQFFLEIFSCAMWELLVLSVESYL